ncbi:MAG: hypothetical protein H8E94_07960 [Alphaproteobacteria bacterium]|nr:hypothetical protein [Alphaproteobacteria bacterium]
MTLRTIPLIDAGTDGAPGALAVAPQLLSEIMQTARRRYGLPAMWAADAVSRRWMEKTADPYLSEIAQISERIASPGVYMLNLSFEWSCTTGLAPDPTLPGNRMLRTLDWPLEGLGRTLIVSRHESRAGDYYNVTWPGFAGITTAMAPGRFAAAINQPPMRWTSPVMALDWVANRAAIWRNGGLPPAHLLRKVFDECATYDEAKQMLCETPVCIPVFYTLSGTSMDQSCAIERMETRADIREGSVSTANHWISFNVPGRARGLDSVGRWHRMEEVRALNLADDFAWVAPPILNATTRVAVVANARAQKLMVQGWEKDGPATEIFTL